MTDLTTAEAEKILAGVAIPPRPSIVNAVLEERSRAAPNLSRIAQLIATDVGLSAAVLKTINSPLFGLRRQISSIEHGVALLGMKNIGALVMSLSLRNAVPTQGLERFWDEAARTALVSAYLAKTLGCSPKEDAHLFGLFHDAGIPLLLRRFPNYRDTLKRANEEPVRSFTDVEDDEHGTNHAVVGSLLAKGWQLPDHIREGIGRHHEHDIFQSHLPAESINLVALTHLAEHIEGAFSRLACDTEWDKRGEAIMAHLMLNQDQLEELSNDAREMLEETGL